MIVKERDVTDETIAQLEQLEIIETDIEIRSTIRQVRAKLKANTTTDHACAVINDLFSATADWVVLHDLRLRLDNRMFYANHLLINDALEFFVIDTRYIEFGLTVDDTNSWRAHTAAGSRVIASPINKLNRDLRFLHSCLKTNDILPRYFGVIRPCSVKGFILTNPSIRSGKSRDCNSDISSLVASDTLFSLIWKGPEHWLSKRLKPESTESLQLLASKLGEMHYSVMPAQLASLQLPKRARQLATDLAHCSDCGKGVCESVREQCFRQMQQFRGKILCTLCQNKYHHQRPMFASY